MAEVTTPADLVIVEYNCDECKEGKMVSTGIARMSHPPKYVHLCDKCRHEQMFSVSYPTTRYMRRENKDG